MRSERPAELLRIVSLLAEAGCEFVVVGGLALRIQGGSQITYDADFAITRRRANARALAAALAPFHPRPVEFPEDLPFIWDEETIMRSSLLTLETDLGRIDLLAEPAGAPPFDELMAHTDVFELKGRKVHVACIEDLISMKKAAGRPKDLAHIAELESIQRLLKEQG